MQVFAVLMRLAWRNLWRNHRRTSIMLAAITLRNAGRAAAVIVLVLRSPAGEMLAAVVRTMCAPAAARDPAGGCPVRHV